MVRLEDGIWCVFTSDRVIIKFDLASGEEIARIDVPEPHPEPHGLTLFEDKLLFCDAASGWIATIETDL